MINKQGYFLMKVVIIIGMKVDPNITKVVEVKLVNLLIVFYTSLDNLCEVVDSVFIQILINDDYFIVDLNFSEKNKRIKKRMLYRLTLFTTLIIRRVIGV